MYIQTVKFTLPFAILVAISTATAQASNATWNDIEAKATQNDISKARIEIIHKICDQNNISDESALKILNIALNSTDPLRANLIMMKIEEGLSKGVADKLIISAAKKRQQSVASAERLITHHLPKIKVRSELMPAIVSGIETGIPSSTISTLLQETSKRRPSEIKTIIENAEALKLANFSANDTETLVLEFLRNNLDNAAMQTAVNFAVTKYQQGFKLPIIRAMLWGKPDGLLVNRKKIRSNRLTSEERRKY